MMNVLIAAFLKRHLAVLVLIAALLVVGFSLYWRGWSDRGAQEIVKEQKHQINRTNNRGKINEKVRNLDDAGLCGALGGVLTDNQC